MSLLCRTFLAIERLNDNVNVGPSFNRTTNQLFFNIICNEEEEYYTNILVIINIISENNEKITCIYKLEIDETEYVLDVPDGIKLEDVELLKAILI